MIKLDSVCKFYLIDKQKVTALSDINFSVSPGEIIGILGKNGAGKSSLLRCISLLEKPSSGTVMINGQDLYKLSKQNLNIFRQKIGMVFQPSTLLESQTVRQNISFPLDLRKGNKQSHQETVESLLTLTELTSLSEAYPKELTLEQKLRVSIARALATNPSVLLCDEITALLDPEATESINQLIQTIHQRFGLSTLLVTKDIETIKKMTHRAIVLDNGKIIEDNTVINLLGDPKTEVAKRLVQSTVKIPSSLQNKISENPHDNSMVILKIQFTGKTAKKPIVEELCKAYDLRLNILQAQVETLHNETIGTMVLGACAKQVKMHHIIDYLAIKNLKVDVLGYVKPEDWFN